MADKKITDLTLRSNCNDDVNFPVDDGVQTYRVTAPQVLDYINSGNVASSDLKNYSLACSVGSSALTIALKNAAGNNASAASPVKMAFRSTTLTSGLPVFASLASSLSTVISSGSTAGHKDAVASYLYIYAMNNGGAIELAWSSSPWDEGSLQSTTAEGGAGAADERSILYSTTARSNLAIRFIGRLKSTQTTAGTWAAVPTEVSLTPVSQGFAEMFIGVAHMPVTASTYWEVSGVTSLTSPGVETGGTAPLRVVDFNAGPGTIDTAASHHCDFTVKNLPPGLYRVEFEIDLVCSATGTRRPTAAINDGTTTAKANYVPETNQGQYQLTTMEGFFHYTSTADRTFELFIWESLLNTEAIADIRFYPAYFKIWKLAAL